MDFEYWLNMLVVQFFFFEFVWRCCRCSDETIEGHCQCVGRFMLTYRLIPDFHTFFAFELHFLLFSFNFVGAI